MATLNYITTLELDNLHLTGITDLVVRGGPVPVLYTASNVSHGMTAWGLGENLGAQFVDQIGISPWRGTQGLNQITVAQINGQDVLVPAGQDDDRMAFHHLSEDGGFDGLRILGAAPSQIGGFTQTEVIQLAGKTFMVASQKGISGFQSFRVRDDLSLEFKRHVDDNARAHIDAVDAFASGTMAGRSFFFAASGIEDGVTAYWMGQWGNIKERGSIGPDNGLWVDAPSALATAEVGGKLYLIVGAAGSGTLTSVLVNQWGGLFPRDHELDDLTTRFGGVSAVETVMIGDRAYVLAGGSDDGISLFELSADGRLHHLVSLADQMETTLNNVTAIAAVVVGGELQVFVAGGEAGVTQFSVDLGTLGAQVVGDNGANTLTGTAQDDMIVGFDGNDTLRGEAGDDRLIDGMGVDVMTGGAGADVFVFVQDGRLDTVTDFQNGVDRLDMSDFALLYTVDRLDFVQKDYGVLVRFGADRLRLEAQSGQLMVADLGAGDFIF